MKKIPTLFIREFHEDGTFTITDKVIDGMEWVLAGEGDATVKYDGSCCAIINGEFYKRYDAKKGKKPPIGAIPCCEPDPKTGHHPHWVMVDRKDPSDKWFVSAYDNTALMAAKIVDGTYEAVGVHFQNNPYRLGNDILVRHGTYIVDVERTFEGIKEWLETHNEEGIVFWKDGEPQCKIKRVDFGLEWNGSTQKRRG